MNKTQLWLQGFLYSIIAALTPVYAVVASDVPITTRVMAAVSIGGIIAGATALKAYLSTTFSDTREPEKPQEVVIKQPPAAPVPVSETPSPSVVKVSRKTTPRIK